MNRSKFAALRLAALALVAALAASAILFAPTARAQGDEEEGPPPTQNESKWAPMVVPGLLIGVGLIYLGGSAALRRRRHRHHNL